MKRKELRNVANRAILAKIEDVGDRLLSSGEDKDVGWISEGGRDTTVHYGQDIYRVIVTVKLEKLSTEV